MEHDLQARIRQHNVEMEERQRQPNRTAKEDLDAAQRDLMIVSFCMRFLHKCITYIPPLKLCHLRFNC